MRPERHFQPSKALTKSKYARLIASAAIDYVMVIIDREIPG